MTSQSTYRAILYGPNSIAAGQEVDLPYIDGKEQEIVVLSTAEGDDTITRTYRKVRETTDPTEPDEPIAYRFVDEDDSEGEPNVAN